MMVQEILAQILFLVPKKRIKDISEYDHDLEELITLAPKKETIKNDLMPISKIDDSNIYERLTGE
jgi:hypothetical protein